MPPRTKPPSSETDTQTAPAANVTAAVSSVDVLSKLRLPATCDAPTESSPAVPKTWIIFGATGHMGRSLVRTALSHGDYVTAVGRTNESTMTQMREGWRWSKDAKSAENRCLGMLCDVRLRETVEEVVQTSIQHWSRIDIVVNCTGYGLVAAAEDQSHDDLYNQFSTNFLGTLHILQSTLTYFRTKAIPGRYLIFSSTAGALGYPGLSSYCATKYAVEGLIESMLYEVDCFGIKATLVEPGHVRTDDLEVTGDAATGSAQAKGPSSSKSKQNQVHEPLRRYAHFVIKPNPSAPYALPTSPAGHAKRTFAWLNTRQPTSAVRSAELVWQLGHCTYPPLRLLLGGYAVESIRDRLRCVIEEIEEWKFLSDDIDEMQGVEFSQPEQRSQQRLAHTGRDVSYGSELQTDANKSESLEVDEMRGEEGSICHSITNGNYPDPANNNRLNIPGVVDAVSSTQSRRSSLSIREKSSTPRLGNHAKEEETR